MTTTHPQDLPPDVAAKILKAQNAIRDGDPWAAYAHLLRIADPTGRNAAPWAALEQCAARAARPDRTGPPPPADVYALIAEHLDCLPSTIQDTTRLVADLGMDDLDLVELMMLLEETYDIQLPDEPPEFHTVADVWQTVRAAVAAAGRGQKENNL